MAPARTAALWALSCLVLVVLSVLFADRPIATWSHDVLHRPAIAVGITKLAGFWLLEAPAVAIAVAYLALRATGGAASPLLRAVFAAAVATLLALLAVMTLKYVFGRLWPETWTHDNASWIGMHAYAFQPFHGGEGNGSFPSGHTARMTAPCAVLWRRVPRLRPVWALLPVLIAGALIASNFHFLADTIAGAYLGVACAAVVLAALP